MPDYLTIAAAREAPGLRLVGLRGVPSPWTEAARGLFHIKGLDCRYAARGRDEAPDVLERWAGDSGIPVVAYENEKLRTGWAEILLLAERLAPEPAMIPSDPEARAELFGISHEICGEMGLGWCVRLLMIQRSLEDNDGVAFPSEVAGRLAAKYGFSPGTAGQAKARVREILAMLDRRLDGHPYLLGESLSAADVYWATFANLLTPLPEEQLPAAPLIRKIYGGADADLVAAVSERLRRHQHDIYQQHLQLPVPL